MTPEIEELEKQILLLRRDHLVENLFIADHVKEDFFYEDDYQIWIVTGLERTFIALVESHWDTPERIWVNRDGSVYVGSMTEGSGGIMMPTCQIDDGRWYDGDEIQQVGQIELTKADHWQHMVGEIKLTMLNVSNQTKILIAHTYMEQVE